MVFILRRLAQDTSTVDCERFSVIRQVFVIFFNDFEFGGSSSPTAEEVLHYRGHTLKSPGRLKCVADFFAILGDLSVWAT